MGQCVLELRAQYGRAKQDPNLVKLDPEDFTWHKRDSLVSKQNSYDTWQVPNWYPPGITRGEK